MFYQNLQVISVANSFYYRKMAKINTLSTCKNDSTYHKKQVEKGSCSIRRCLMRPHILYVREKSSITIYFSKNLVKADSFCLTRFFQFFAVVYVHAKIGNTRLYIWVRRHSAGIFVIIWFLNVHMKSWSILPLAPPRMVDVFLLNTCSIQCA